jgi:hypothetical protein
MSDPLGDGADLLRRLDPDWLGLPAPALIRAVAPGWLINLPPIDLAYPIPLPPSDAELAARAEAAAADAELANAGADRGVSQGPARMEPGDHLLSGRPYHRPRHGQGVRSGSGQRQCRAGPARTAQYVNAPVEPWVHEYWNNLQRDGSGNGQDPSAARTEPAPSAGGDGGGIGAQPAIDTAQLAAPSSAPAPTSPELASASYSGTAPHFNLFSLLGGSAEAAELPPVKHGDSADGATPQTSGTAPVTDPTEQHLKTPDEVVAQTPSITVSLPPLDTTNPDVGGTVYYTDTLTGDTRSATIVGGSSNGGYFIGDPGNPGYVGRALVTQIVPPQPLGINGRPITDPLNDVAAAVGSGIKSVISSPFGQRLLGGLEAVGGVAEGVAGSSLFAAGAVAEGTLLGIPAGLLLQGAGIAALANASDNILTGTRQVISGTSQQTVAAQIAGDVATRAGASPATVQAVENAVQLGQNIAGIGALAGAARVGTSLPQPIVLPPASGLAPNNAVVPSG